jgi:hypothetical protein
VQEAQVNPTLYRVAVAWLHRLAATALVLLIWPAPVPAQGRIPADCYVDQRGNTLNTCKYCHTSGQPGALNHDIDRQGAFPAVENPFLNALNPARLDSLVPPITIPADLGAYLALDNYHAALSARGGSAAVGSGVGEYRFFPDLDPDQTGADGFANNGWRAWKWKPNQLAWPRFNGRIQQNWLRLPERFRRTAAGSPDLGVYRQNLDLLVQVLRGDVTTGTYYGQAADEPVVAYRFPAGAEVVHYLYYLDPSRPGMKATRIKEVRWNIKTVPTSLDQEYFGYVSKQEKALSLTWRAGGPAAAAAFGLAYNEDGWDIIAFIERPDGSLRPQNQAELTQCLSCHSGRLGVPVDSHWQSLQRQLPGDAGWAVQDYQGIFDYYNAGLGQAEMAETFVSSFGDASGLTGLGDGSIAYLPTAAQARALTRRYYQIVQTQTFALGREPVLAADPKMLRAPATARFRPPSQQQPWLPALDFSRFDRLPAATAVAASTRPTTAATVLSPAFPNPFNGSTQVRFVLRQAGPVRLAVYGADGGLVRQLEQGEKLAGPYQTHWDGGDGAGRACASGVYWLQLQAGDQRLTQPVVLVR